MFRLIIKFEISLGFAIQEPEIAHLHGTGALAFDGVVDDADGGGVVDVYRSRRLRMAQFF